MFLLGILMLGCRPMPVVVNNQNESINIVWLQVYQASKYVLPEIEWVLPKDLDCDSGTRFKSFNDKCVYGVYSKNEDLAQIAYRNHLLSQTSLAHELLHSYLFKSTGTPTLHDTPEWQPGGLLNQANQALREAGL